MAKQAPRSNSVLSPKPHAPTPAKVVPFQSGMVVEQIVQPVVTTLVRIDDEGHVFVAGPGVMAGKELEARSIIYLLQEMIGREVLVLFERGDPTLPIITGLIQSPTIANRQVVAETDGKRLVLSAEEAVTLECGQASITLTKHGKILIQGAYVLSRSSGANKIKGASIEIN